MSYSSLYQAHLITKNKMLLVSERRNCDEITKSAFSKITETAKLTGSMQAQHKKVTYNRLLLTRR